jgi:hypothetical protein
MLFGIQKNFKFVKMKNFLLSVLTISILFVACQKSSIEESKFQLKTKPLSYETLSNISQKLKNRGFVNIQNSNVEKNSFKTESNSNTEIIEIIQPLIDNGRDLQIELIGFIESSNEWQSMSLIERNEITQMSDEQLADLSLLYSGLQTNSISDAIKDCVSTALGISGLGNLAKSMFTAPTVSSAIGILKWVGKRYLSYIGVAWMIWDFTDCMSHF